MNILVTGAAGYIGSICAEVLLSRGMKVIALDSLLEGHRAAVPPGVAFCQVDLGDRNQIESVFVQHNVDAVMHFAAEALVAKSVKEPSIFYATNVACGVNLLDAMTRHGVRKFIFSSTAATYGEPKTVPIPEDHPKAPINPYGKSKLIFEEILADYKAYTGLQYVSLRYFNAAGASRERGEHHRVETHLIPRVLDAAAGVLPHVDVFGTDYPTSDGTCVRDYIHILDIADSHVRALEEIDRVSGEAFNVGNSRGFSILEVIDAAERITGRKIPRKLGPRRPGDPAVLVASKEKLKRTLGWEASHSSLEEIIQSAWTWKQEHPRGYEDEVRVSV
ncbi:MAG: UDP-glucose 4-epimerase GalE [Acidobacteria bacterium]|nr:MAG: UDP-glucose 4-epimerase GalE [Acidobacteria bacterium 13_1_40CM_4_58_4]PYT63732.1 MAG: UDP-glucose 4-epimerase GalE [Acidobacteriota bacterium]